MKALVLCGKNGFDSFKRGTYPEHLLYGSSELDRMGYNLVFLSDDKDKGKLFKILACIINQRPDLILIPYVLNMHMLLALVKRIFFPKVKLLGWIHKDLIPRNSGKLLSRMWRFYVSCFIGFFDKLFCLSEKTMAEERKAFNAKNLIFIPWAGDLEYYNRFYSGHDQRYCISTGKENRKVDLLFETACNDNLRLKIYINDETIEPPVNSNISLHAGWFDLDFLLHETANSSFVAIPINEGKINYCVGLSSVVEAMGLGKPVIATYNPYWHIDIEKENIGIFIRNNTKTEWARAIEKLSSNKSLAMKMGENGRRLALGKYNFHNVAQELRKHFEK